MNKSLPASIAAFLLAVSLPLSPAHAQSSNGVAAVVNGKVITRSEVRDVVKEQRTMIIMSVKDTNEQSRMLADLESQALYALIERELILSEFTKMGGQMKPAYVDDAINGLVRERFEGDREKFLAELAKSGMTIKKFREIQEKQMIVGYMRQRHMKDLAPPAPAQVEKYYRDHDDQFRDKDFIKMSTITVPKYPVGDAHASPEAQRKLIEELRGKVTGGADFAQIAKTYSQDSRAESGGDWDWVERSVLDKNIADAAFSLKVGGVTKVLDVGPSYMIIYCEAKRPGTLKKLDDVRPDIEKRIQSETGRAALGGWMRNLMNKSMIQPESVQKGFLDYVNKPDKQ
jgi:parvulin-like peptidyl-prolyl isomerase